MKNRAWELVLEVFNKEFVEILFPDISPTIDWTNVIDLNKELDEELDDIRKDLFNEQDSNKIYADKVLKVNTFNGKSLVILIHTETQSYNESKFSQRMFKYFYRLHDKYCDGKDTNVITSAIIAYRGHTGKINKYSCSGGGSELNYYYSIIDVDSVDLPQNNGVALVLKIAKKYLSLEQKSDKILLEAKRELLIDIENNIPKLGLDKVKVRCLVDFLEYLFSFKDKELNKEFKVFKRSLQGISEMSVDDIIKDHYVEEGEKKKAIEIAKSLLDVLDVETIAKKTGLTIEEVENLK